MEGQLKVDVGLLLDSAVRGCYVCTLLLRETQRSNGATMPTLPSKSIYSYLLCSRSLVSAGTRGNEDRRCYEDDYGATHGIILTDCHELGNSYVTLFVRHPSTSKPPHAFCRSIYTGSDECLERCKLWLQHCLESHPKCHHGSSPKAPTRLIEIRGPHEVRLVEPTAGAH
jgi:hypothetical protein